MLSLFREKGWLDLRNHPLKNLILQSFGRESLLIFKSKAPEIPATYLISDRDFVHWLNDIDFAKENKFILGPPKALFKVPIVKQHLLKSGLPIHGWTVDSVKGMESAQKLNFAGIFTNRTDLAIQIYRKALRPDIDSVLKSLGY
jgi:glycerophosphoryl diester phosphodiesterase